MPYRSRAVRTAISAAALLSTLIPADQLAAQADGTPIRLQTAARPGKWITGRAAGVTADSIGIVPLKHPDTLRYARGDLQRMDVSRGRKSYAGRGALIGTGVGLAIGVVVVATADWNDCSDWEGLCEVAGAGIVALSTAGGAGAGAIIGAFSHHEKWKAVKLGQHVSAGLQGHRGVGLTIEF